MTKSSCQEDAVFKEISSFFGEASGRNWGGLQREWTGNEEGKGRWGGDSATLRAVASQPRGEEPEGFGFSTLLLMSLFSCCNS